MLAEMSSKNSKTTSIEKNSSVQKSFLPDSKDIVVQNFVPSEINPVFIQKIWEDNRRDDLRMMRTAECDLETSLLATKQPSNIGLDDPMDNGLTESRTAKTEAKEGSGRPKKTTNELMIANGSLSDSNFVQRKTKILKEAKEMLKLVGDEVVVMERKGPWIGNKATFNSKDCKATTMYDCDIVRDKVGECFTQVWSQFLQ
ncbi:hypothetical protein V6N13_138375 [Hibiscus sabdariffa]|uniref:Uncharacterized protein n=1 Tax=Hibiscus sabdariffa TaxID=183260 RepID=A0ABR2QD83_9ROSI